MREFELLQKLEEIPLQLGIEVRRDPGEYSGGLCRVGERWVFIINPALSVNNQVEILRRGLAELDLSGLFLLPAIRAYIDSLPERINPGTEKGSTRMPERSEMRPASAD